MWVKGYDRQKRLFLPPVIPGEKLPQEILQAWEKEKQSGPLAAYEPEGSGIDIDQGSHSQLRLPVISSLDVLQKGFGGKTPLHSTTALLSVPELGVIESVICLMSQTLGDFSQGSVTGLDVPPVAAAIARYMGVNLSSEGAIAEHRKVIALVVHGPPLSGRTTQAQALSKRYNAALINVDELLKDLISHASTAAGYKAREVCIEAEKEREEQLSFAAIAGGKKASTKEIREKDQTKDKEQNAVNQEDVNLPVQPFAVQPLENTQVAVPESKLHPVALPEELIVEILADRLQQPDCRQGIVIDGIESAFAADPATAIKAILKAVNNRKHIYVIHLEMELTAIKERKKRLGEEAKKQAKEKVRIKEELKKQEEIDARKQMEIDEDEYEALSEEKRKEFDDKLLAVKKEKLLERKKEKEEKEQLELERREEEERRLAEEMLKKKKGKGKKVQTAPTPSRPMSAVKQNADPLAMASQASFASGVGTPAKVRGRGSLKSPGVTEQHFLEDPLDVKFNYHQHHLGTLETLLTDWDRVAAVDRPVLPEEPVKPPTPVKKSYRKGSVTGLRPPSPPPLPTPAPEVKREDLGVPLIKVSGIKSKEELMEDISRDLPAPEEVGVYNMHALIQSPPFIIPYNIVHVIPPFYIQILETLGLGTGGPPIATPATFQVYPYPLKRMKLQDQDRFMFIAASRDDPYVFQRYNIKSRKLYYSLFISDGTYT